MGCAISYRVICSSAQSFQSLFFGFIRVRLQSPLFSDEFIPRCSVRICHYSWSELKHFPPLSIKLFGHSLPRFMGFYSMHVWLNTSARIQEDSMLTSWSSFSEWLPPSDTILFPFIPVASTSLNESVSSPQQDSHSLLGSSSTAPQSRRKAGHSVQLISFIPFSQGL